MHYSELADLYEELEANSSTLKKAELLTGFFAKTQENLLPAVVLLAQGKVFPSHSDKELGIASKLAVKIISKVAGVPAAKVVKQVNSSGDYGLAAEHFIQNRKQMTLAESELDVATVFARLQAIAEVSGSGAIDRKMGYVSELLSGAKPKEARYLVRTLLGELRIGVGEGTIRDGISGAFGVDAVQVERAYSVLNDYGQVALIAKKDGERGLKKAKLETFRPIKVMLAQKAAGVDEVIKRFGKAAYEYKYDGARMVVHKKSKKIRIFTRSLDDVTKQFPDIVEMCGNLKAKEAILEGEGVGFDPKTGKNLPFQKLSRRIKRKYEIEEMAKKIPVRLNLFDIVYLDGENLIEMPFGARRKLLEKIVVESDTLILAKQIISDDPEEINGFYQQALSDGQEGLMAKNLEAPYKPGSRVGHMLKLKPTMETLDLAVVGAEWGEGRRASWLGSFLLACRDEVSGELKTIGKLGTGMTDVQFKELTELFKPLIVLETGNEIKIKPEIVMEVSYEEIQKSPKYKSGFALRFPRLVQLREDRGVDDVSDLNYIEQLYGGQN